MTIHERTAGPWKLSYYGTGDPKTYAGCSRRLSGSMYYICDLPADLSEANAKFIIEAVNSYDHLQSQLTEAQRALKKIADRETSNYQAELALNALKLIGDGR